MQATLVYNPNAGRTAQVGVEDLLGALKNAGFEAWYSPTDTEDELDATLRNVEGLVVAAGGDGTIRAVASRLAGKDVLLAPVPLGTANNLGVSLGISGNPLEIVSRLSSGQERALDIGCIHSSWGEDYFLEAAGYGLFAEVLHRYEPDKGKSLLRGLDSILKTLTDYRVETCNLRLDGKDLGGKYLLVEAFNTPLMGPRLRLASEADTGDGLFDVVLIKEEARGEWVSFFTRMLRDELVDHPAYEIHRGRLLEFVRTGFAIHYDAMVLPEMQDGPSKKARRKPAQRKEEVIRLEVLPGAVRLLLPGTKVEKKD
ncbi:MAG TPA: diacylglycerol kinase family protein [Anaerolineales bacterium]|nr:diacylglycerol kinase family protein [Anaerolineales bacterium]